MNKRYALAAAGTLVAALSPGLHAQSAPVAKDVTVLSYKIHYWEAGTGSPVLLLHGTGGEGARWMPNIKALAAEHHVYAIDQIGFGQSDKPLTNYHTGVMAEFATGFLKAVGVSKASVVGQSMGGNVALYMAVHYPQMVDHLVMVDGGGFRAANAPAPAAPATPNWHARQIANAATKEESLEYLKLLYYDNSIITEKMIEDNLILRLKSAFTIDKMSESGAKGLGVMTEDEVSALNLPTLIVWGNQDKIANPAGAERLHAAIKASRVVMIDKASHYPFLEQADQFNKLVLDFLKTGGTGATH
jgi:2-hydroxy-6-oxonona-2,4-dienedioate hydrolase